MNIQVQGIHLSVTEAIRTYVEEKVSKLKKFIRASDSAIISEVEVGKVTAHHHKGKIFFCEVHLVAPGPQFRAKAIEEDLYIAIDKAVKELYRQLTDFKEKRIAQERKKNA